MLGVRRKSFGRNPQEPSSGGDFGFRISILRTPINLGILPKYEGPKDHMSQSILERNPGIQESLLVFAPRT